MEFNSASWGMAPGEEGQHEGPDSAGHVRFLSAPAELPEPSVPTPEPRVHKARP